MRFNENVRAVAKKKGLKLGQVEKYILKSAGYFSRNPDITLKDACRLADLLDESLEDLINQNFEEIYRARDLKEKRDYIKQELERLNKELEEMGEDDGSDMG